MKQTQTALEGVVAIFPIRCKESFGPCYKYWNGKIKEINTPDALKYCPDAFKEQFEKLIAATKNDDGEKLKSALTDLEPKTFWSKVPNLMDILNDINRQRQVPTQIF